MKKTSKNLTLNDANGREAKDMVQAKDYKSPKLTAYGDISKLVMAMGGTGTDGSGMPPFSLT